MIGDVLEIPLVNAPTMQNLHDTARQSAEQAFDALGFMPSLLWTWTPAEDGPGCLHVVRLTVGERMHRRVTRLLVRSQLRAASSVRMYAIIAPSWLLSPALRDKMTIVSAAERHGAIVSAALKHNGRKTVLLSPVVNLFDEIEP